MAVEAARLEGMLGAFIAARSPDPAAAMRDIADLHGPERVDELHALAPNLPLEDAADAFQKRLQALTAIQRGRPSVATVRDATKALQEAQMRLAQKV